MSTLTPQQLDGVADENHPELDQSPFALILQHLAGDISLDDTVCRLTAPINLSYSTADSGNAIRQAEETAAQQRTFYAEDAEDEVREQWGDPLPESEIPPAALEGTPSTEEQLWDLWYAVLHEAKQTPWQNDRHAKLVALVAAIKRVPDPPLPANATKALRNDWIWETGTLWSKLALLGAATRETWNDGPGGGFAHSEAAISAWANVNAFVAGLTAEGVRDYSLYAIWAMRDALEEKKKVKEGNWLDATLPAAAAWIGVWGKEMYARREDLTPEDPRYGNPARPGNYMIQRTNNEKPAWSPERWAFWKLRFEEIAGEEVSDETKAIAKAAFERMEEIERA